MKKILLIIMSFFVLNLSVLAEEDFAPSAKSAILVDNLSGKVLYEKNADEKLAPASMTKLASMLIVMEAIDNGNLKLEDKVTISEEAANMGGSQVFLQAGEVYTVHDLLKSVAIASGNDAVVALAEKVGGSVSGFVDMINKRLKELGATNTNFVNPNGVHNENQYTTAYDLSLIGKYAMNNETFRKIVCKTSYTLPATNIYSSTDRKFENTNELLSSDNYSYEYTTGIKTGYTDSAKNCIVASAKKDNYNFIVVILGANKTTQTKNERASDCITLFNYAINNYKEKTVFDSTQVLKQLEITLSDNTTQTLDILAEKDIKVLTTQNISDLMPEITLNDKIQAPILKGSVVGKITYTIDGIVYTSNLVAGNNILDSDILPQIFSILLIILLFFIFITLIKFRKHRKKNDVFMKFYK